MNGAPMHATAILRREHHHQQQTPARQPRNPSVNGQNRGDPRFRSQAKGHAMHKSAGKRHRGPSANQHDHQNADADPGVNGEIKSRE
jgi:hypothetical protein